MSLLLIMGLPAAGKSTLCSEIQEHLTNATVFSLDEMNGRWSNEFRAHADRKSFEQAVRHFLKQNCNDEFDGTVIVDDIFYLRSMRRPFERMARAFGIHYCCVLVHCEVQDAMQRNSVRGENRVSEETILKIAQQMEVPSEALVYKCEGLQEILEKLNETRVKLNSQPRRSPSQNSISFLSEMDGLLRVAVSEAVRQGMDGRILAAAKKAILTMCRKSGNVLSNEQVREVLLNEYWLLNKAAKKVD